MISSKTSHSLEPNRGPVDGPIKHPSCSQVCGCYWLPTWCPPRSKCLSVSDYYRIAIHRRCDASSKDWKSGICQEPKLAAAIGSGQDQLPLDRAVSVARKLPGSWKCLRLTARCLLVHGLGTHASPYHDRIVYLSSEFWMIRSAEHVRIYEKSRASLSIYFLRSKMTPMVVRFLLLCRFTFFWSPVVAICWLELVSGQGRFIAPRETQEMRSPARP